MPLIIDDVQLRKCPLSVKDFIQQFTLFKEDAKLLTSQETKVIDSKGLLYIGQREFGGTSPEDDMIKVIGSEDATTCHIGVLRNTGSGAVCLLHFDGSNTGQGLSSMVDVVKDLSQGKQPGRLDFHLVGGFNDDKRISEGLSLDLINSIMMSGEDIHLITACIGDLNTIYKGNTPYPIIYGIGVEVQTGKLFKATFPDHGPDQALRSARHFTGSHDNLSVYNYRNKQLQIGPFTYGQLSDLDLILRMPESFFRQQMSTSPAQEPDNFEANVKASLLQMKQHPEPMLTVFLGGKPRCYKQQPDGKWIRI